MKTFINRRFVAPFRLKHWESRSYQWNVSNIISDKERMDSIASYYGQSAVDVAAAKQVVRLKTDTLLYTGKSQDGSHVLKSAQYLLQELPVRLAQQIMRFRSLPFIIGCNPTLLSVHDLYLKTFMGLTQFSTIDTLEVEAEFSKFVKSSLDNLSPVLGLLAKGFSECNHKIQDPQFVQTFLDNILTSRLGVRLLAEHHLALKEDRPSYIGIINQRMSLTNMIRKQAKIVDEMFELQYGMAPEVVIAGQTKLVFPYIPSPLEYILIELLKNAYRATIESRVRGSSKIPPIYLTLASDGGDFWVRISDHGGGVPSEVENKIWHYTVSTPSKAGVDSGWASAMESQQPVGIAGANSAWHQLKEPDVIPPPTASNSLLRERITLNSGVVAGNAQLPPVRSLVGTNPLAADQHVFANLTQHSVAQSIHGYGFGLPTSRAYARYLEGDLALYTIRGLGTDCYLRLRHIDGKKDSFRI